MHEKKKKKKDGKKETKTKQQCHSNKQKNAHLNESSTKYSHFLRKERGTRFPERGLTDNRFECKI